MADQVIIEIEDYPTESSSGGVSHRFMRRDKLDPRTAEDYEKELSNLIRRVNGNLSTESAVRDFKLLARKYGTESMLSGATTVKSKAKLTPSASAQLEQWVNSQATYFRRWCDQIKGTLPVPSKFSDSRRIQLYGNSLEAPYARGVLSGFDPSRVVSWKLSDSEHCPSCLELHENSPYEISDLPTVPREGQTLCKNSCKCHLVVHSRLSGAVRKLVKKLLK